jgi:hypothetical protein
MKRSCLLLAVAPLFGLALTSLWAADTKGVDWKHGLNFQVRRAGQTEFTDKTPKFGAEIFLDKDITKLVYVCETSSLGLGSAAKVGAGQDVKAPKLLHALEVRVRGANEMSFSDKTRKFSSEVFKDVNTDQLVYISEKGSIAVTPGAGISAPAKIKDPVWFHGLEVKVRKVGEKEFGDKTKKVGLEVYKDENTNHLFYITDAGRIAVVPAGSASKPSEVKPPTWFHAFEVKVRKADEKEFSKDTRTYSVEVYKDDNANTLLYICETGDIAVVSAAGVDKPSSSKEPKWLYGRSFRVRKADEPDFNDGTRKFGAEVYQDENTGNQVYITETGTLAVSAK